MLNNIKLFFAPDSAKSSPGLDKPAEYRSPPGKRLNAKKIDDPSQVNKLKEKQEKTLNRVKSMDSTISSEPVNVVDLSNMSSKQLVDHVEGLRNTVECKSLNAVLSNRWKLKKMALNKENKYD